MTDILAEWKKNKFITVGPELLDDQEILVILTDIAFWSAHEKDLEIWCNQHGASVGGMAVTFPDQKTLTAFCLRWS
jgi:hypothetical protein